MTAGQPTEAWTGSATMRLNYTSTTCILYYTSILYYTNYSIFPSAWTGSAAGPSRSMPMEKMARDGLDVGTGQTGKDLTCKADFLGAPGNEHLLASVVPLRAQIP